MEITKRRLADIVPYAANAKKHDKRQINNVAESIKQYGFVQPIVIDRNGVIVIGHCRALAAKKLGMEEVPFTKLGDIWKLGRHRLMCGDSTSAECVQKLMGGHKQIFCLQTRHITLIMVRLEM